MEADQDRKSAKNSMTTAMADANIGSGAFM
jgi:hypothetical protein